ncbi:MAG: glycosyltransferase family 2 protein [Hyphomicrobiales bacterium]|nr:glycosyltransferase family 2 protein [Hyphomicrobiales bacterium]
MRFSVLIPTYNRADLLDQALRSALAQTHRNFEILIIDDGSTDPTPEVASRYGSAVKYWRQENQGKSAALNLGIRKAEGDILMVLDDDDILPAWSLAKHAEALSQRPAAGFSYGRFARFAGNDLSSPAQLNDNEMVPTHDPRRLVVKLMENCFLPNPVWAVRKDLQARVGPYDRDMYFSQDYDMILRLARGNEGTFVDDVVLYQRKHGSLRGPQAEQENVVDTIAKWIKYDALLFERLDRSWDIGDFHPFSNKPGSGEEGLAYLQKGVILFQRKVYDGARRALASFRSLLMDRSPTVVELRIAAGLLGCRYGIAELVDHREHGENVAQWLHAKGWPLPLRMAFGSQLRWRVRAAAASGQVKFARDLLSFSHKAFGLAATVAIMGSKYAAGTHGWRVPKSV